MCKWGVYHAKVKNKHCAYCLVNMLRWFLGSCFGATDQPWWEPGAAERGPFHGGILYVKRKVGARSYADDPIGCRSLLSRALHKVWCSSLRVFLIAPLMMALLSYAIKFWRAEKAHVFGGSLELHSNLEFSSKLRFRFSISQYVYMVPDGNCGWELCLHCST